MGRRYKGSKVSNDWKIKLKLNIADVDVINTRQFFLRRIQHFRRFLLFNFTSS